MLLDSGWGRVLVNPWQGGCTRYLKPRRALSAAPGVWGRSVGAPQRDSERNARARARAVPWARTPPPTRHLCPASHCDRFGAVPGTSHGRGLSVVTVFNEFRWSFSVILRGGGQE